MKKSGVRTAALSIAAASVLIFAAAPRAGAVSVTVGDGQTGADQDVSIDVTLQTMGEDVAGTQNDIVYPDADIGVVALGNGRPTCSVNPDIEKEGTAFSFQPPQCNASGTCTGVRALVLSLSNVDPIPDGSVLYNCLFAVGPDVDTGEYEIGNVNVGASDPNGVALDATGVAGVIEVIGEADATIVVGSAETVPSGNASVDVSLQTGVDVAGTQNDIAFTPGAAIRAGSNNRPLCAVNPDIMKEGTAFSFQPPQCTVGTTCTGIRALVLSLSNVDPIPNGSVMYSCDIAAGAEEGTFPLTCSNAGASDPAGVALTTACTNGEVEVGGIVVPTDTPIQVTNTPTVTNTPVVSPNTPTRTPTGIVPPPFSDCDDGCAIAAPAESRSGWLLLLPAAVLIWLRRRAR